MNKSKYLFPAAFLSVVVITLLLSLFFLSEARADTENGWIEATANEPGACETSSGSTATCDKAKNKAKTALGDLQIVADAFCKSTCERNCANRGGCAFSTATLPEGSGEESIKYVCKQFTPLFATNYCQATASVYVRCDYGCTMSPGRLEQPVVEQARSFWDYPPFAQIKAFVDLLRRFPPGSWIFPVFDPVLSNELAVVLRLMAVAADDAGEKIVLALEEAEQAQNAYNNAVASEATSKVIAEAKTAVDDAVQAFVDAVNNAQENLIIAQNDVNVVNQSDQSDYAQRMGGGGRPAENSQEVTNEVIKSADTIQARLARLMNELKVEEVLTKAGIITVPTGRTERGTNMKAIITAGKAAADALKNLAKTTANILDKNDKNRAVIEKKASKLTDKLSEQLVKLATRADDANKGLTLDKARTLQGALQNADKQVKKLKELKQKTGYDNDLFDIAIQAAGDLDIVEGVVGQLAESDQSVLAEIRQIPASNNLFTAISGTARTAADAGNDYVDYTQITGAEVEEDGVTTVTVTLRRVEEEPRVGEELASSRENLARLANELQEQLAVVQAAQGVAGEAPTAVEVTLKPSIEAAKLSTTYFRNFDAGEFLEAANNLPPVFARENVENVNITAKINFDGGQVTAEQNTGSINQGDKRPVKFDLSQLSLQTQTALNDASGNINLELTSNPVNAARFLVSQESQESIGIVGHAVCRLGTTPGVVNEGEFDCAQKALLDCENQAQSMIDQGYECDLCTGGKYAGNDCTIINTPEGDQRDCLFVTQCRKSQI